MMRMSLQLSHVWISLHIFTNMILVLQKKRVMSDYLRKSLSVLDACHMVVIAYVHKNMDYPVFLILSEWAGLIFAKNEILVCTRCMSYGCVCICTKTTWITRSSYFKWMDRLHFDKIWNFDIFTPRTRIETISLPLYIYLSIKFN